MIYYNHGLLSSKTVIIMIYSVMIARFKIYIYIHLDIYLKSWMIGRGTFEVMAQIITKSF